MSHVHSFTIKTYSVFRHYLWISGSVLSWTNLRQVFFCVAEREDPRVEIQLSELNPGLSRDPKTFFFDCEIDLHQYPIDPGRAILHLIFDDETSAVINSLGAPRGQSAGNMGARFIQDIKGQSRGKLLEVGSRARSGNTRRSSLPPNWDYTGLDIMAGENVDVVGDAHEIAELFEPCTFDRVMAFSVLEHLLMPWKFVIGLNKVLKQGAVGLFTTHQTWPVHDQPWDFWRYSDTTWRSILNEKTGFEIIESAMGEPAFVVAQKFHNVTAFGMSQIGFLASNVTFKKVADTVLDWPVKLTDVIRTSYPEGNITRAEPYQSASYPAAAK